MTIILQYEKKNSMEQTIETYLGTSASDFPYKRIDT